jgi:hypothetical protein
MSFCKHHDPTFENIAAPVINSDSFVSGEILTAIHKIACLKRPAFSTGTFASEVRFSKRFGSCFHCAFFQTLELDKARDARSGLF